MNEFDERSMYGYSMKRRIFGCLFAVPCRDCVTHLLTYLRYCVCTETWRWRTLCWTSLYATSSWSV